MSDTFPIHHRVFSYELSAMEDGLLHRQLFFLSKTVGQITPIAIFESTYISPPTSEGEMIFCLNAAQGRLKGSRCWRFLLPDSPSMTPPCISATFSMFNDSLCVYLEKQGWPGQQWVWTVTVWVPWLFRTTPTNSSTLENQFHSTSVSLTWLWFLFILQYQQHPRIRWMAFFRMPVMSK